MTGQWYEDRATLVSVAEHLVEQGDLVTAEDVVSFAEKPWKWEHEYLRWLLTEAIKVNLHEAQR